MYGSRSRELMRQAVRRRERSSANALEHMKRSYADMCTKKEMIPQLEENLEQTRKKMKLCKGPQAIKEYLVLKTESVRLQESIP